MTSSLPTPAESDLAPTYDRDAVSSGIVHIGVGAFHRAHQAVYLDDLLRAGEASDWAITGVGVLPGDARMAEIMAEQDCLYTLVLKHPDIGHEPRVIGSIVEYLHAPADPQAVLDVLSAPATRIVSLTVTESGYNIDDDTGEFRLTDGAARDAEHPREPTTTFGYLVEALRRRREAGTPPFTVASCDNLPGNGSVARTSLVGQARASDPDLADWIEENVAFPNGMVDRITPATTPQDVEMVREEFGIDDSWPVVAEPFLQWVLEDDFPQGRPPLEKVGVQLVEDVEPYELMKLRLLNASHQSLAHWGRLLGQTYAHESAADDDIAALTRAYLDTEVRPTLSDVPGIDVEEYVDTLFQRFTNPEIADTLARLAYDGAGRMPKFVLPTIRDNVASGGPVELGAAICAAWALGMEGTAEDGSRIKVEDPILDHLRPLIDRQRAGEDTALIDDQRIFGRLGQDARFREAFTRTLGRLRQIGARAVMRELVG